MPLLGVPPLFGRLLVDADEDPALMPAPAVALSLGERSGTDLVVQ